MYKVPNNACSQKKKKKSEMTYMIIVIPLLGPDINTWAGTLNDFILNLRSCSSEQDDGDSMGISLTLRPKKMNFLLCCNKPHIVV